MKLKVIENDGRKAIIDLNRATTAFVNSLRRILIGEIPILAIKEALIKKNSSVLYDETLAHRLGQIPLKFEPDKYNFSEKCICNGEGCPNCQAILTLAESGPKTVYAEDIKWAKPAKEGVAPVKPLNPRIPIVELLEGQEVELEARARLGIGKDHARHQAALASYRKWPILRIDGRKCKNCNDCVKACPTNSLREGKKKPVFEERSCTLCRMCVKACKEEALQLKGSDERFLLKLESYSCLSCKQLLCKAAEILQQKAEEMLGKLA